MPRIYFRPGVDNLDAHPSPFTRDGEEHTVTGPYTVSRYGGDWEIKGRVEGPLTYGGRLVTWAARPVDGRGNRLRFRTRRDAVNAMRSLFPE